ncbi:response regulator [Neorhizobium lilium]|nr:response regulator [Neorhizobium lilium]
MDGLASADPNIQTTMLEVISEGISGAILVYDKNDRILFASQQVLALLPVPEQFLAPGTRLRDVLGALYDGGVRFCSETSSSRRSNSREDWIAEQIAILWREKADIIERRGPERWISLSKRRLSSGYGVCIVRDVSDQKKREEKWRADMERVQVTEEVLDNLPFTVTVKDQTHTFVAINKAACRFHDKTAESILGHKGEQFQPIELRERLEAINDHVFETGDALQLPERLTRADGSQSIVVANKFRIGKPGRYYVVTAMQDLTRFLTPSSTGEIRPAMMWEEFVSLSLCQGEKDRQSAGSGSVSLASRKILVVSADAEMEREAITALSGLRVDTSSVSSAQELKLFLHLASEAEIQVDLVVLDASLQGDCAEIAAAHGVPTVEIAANDIEDMLVSNVMACLAASGDAGAGSVADDGWEVVEEAKDDTIDVLVAEDNEVNQIVFSQILEGLGYRYAIATDGEQAVQLWQDRAPQLILMDITLPRLNGFEAASSIRSLEEEGSRVPIIGVLPQAFDRDRDECFSSGMDDVILKPISPEALQTVFSKFLHSRQEFTTRK